MNCTAEGLARNLPRFARFLRTRDHERAGCTTTPTSAATRRRRARPSCSGTRCCATRSSRSSCRPGREPSSARPSRPPSFYFFDTGVVRALRRLPQVTEASADFGEFFEHFVFLELRTWIDYRKPRTPHAYWRSRSGYEVDFILDDRIAIEVKATRRIQRKHLRNLRALAEERLVERSIVVCREERPRVEDGIEIWPLEFFLTALWDNAL